ncbi:NAD(P)/FAD-dependent oxidoreductase [Nocardioides sp. CN2-186]|uniref:NAD(P)/FAD-dependent oxidoreductase n=1 Tax=Nocardioides tweenelious TaxID=3156607 RepID=UPI0032B60B0C
MSDATQTRHRVVVVGGGFGGLFATQALRRAPAEVVLVDRTGFHLFQPLLYQVATGILSQGEIARPLREILRRQRNARFLLGQVNSIDLDRRTVTSTALGRTTVTPYDSLVVAAGATHSHFGNEAFVEHAPGLKSIDDALEIRARIFEAFELAENASDHEERCRHLTFVVVGGGPTGVEVAGQIAELSEHSLRRNFRAVDPADARVVVLEAGAAILPAFGEGLSARARTDLEDLGVEVLTGARVVDIDEHRVRYLIGEVDHEIEATTKVWAAGVAASPLGGLLATASGGTPTRSGQLVVQPDCTVPGHPEVFVVGDLMSVPGVPGLAQVAIQSGRFAAAVIRDRLAGRTPPTTFLYRDKGVLATIARFRAVAHVRRLRVSGTLAWLLWLGVHLVTLNGYRNRATVTMHWAVTFVLNGRAERAATPLQGHHSIDHGDLRRRTR